MLLVARTPQPSKMDLADLLNSRPAKGKRPAAKRVRKAQGKARKQCQGSKKRPAKAMPATLSHSGEDDVECCLPTLPPYLLPKTAQQMSLWAFILLERVSAIFGKGFVQKRIRDVKWSCYDLFGGILCVRRAWEMLSAAALEMWGVKSGLTFAFNVEKNSACMKATMEHYPDSCHFRDVLELIKTRPTTDSWNPSSLTLVKEAYCEKHKKMCPLSSQASRPDSCGLLGAPCILWSRYGKQEGLTNTELKRVHDVGTRFQQKSLVSLHENVPQYEEEYLDENLATHHRQCAVLHPRMFGHPNSRARSWRICYHKDKKRWNSRYSLQDLAEILLADKSSKTTLTFQSYFFEQRNAHGEVSEEDLSKSQAYHLEKFRHTCPGNQLFDLSANVAKRRRVELKDRSLPCLTTSSFLWSEHHGRAMTGREHLHALGFPCWGSGAVAAKVDPIDTSKIRQSALRQMAGNGMSLPCAGFTLLMAVLFVEDK